MRLSLKITLGVVSFLLVAAAGFALYQVWAELSQRRQEQVDFKELAALTEIHPEDETPTLPWHDLAQLQVMNPDCIGWLTILDTPVDYPVMQSAETPQKYLHRDFYGDYSYAGVPFLDHRCFADSHNWIIYGHNMLDGSMFGCLKQYLEDGYLAAHPDVYLQTADGLHHYEIFAVAEIQKTDAWYSFLRRATATDYDAGGAIYPHESTNPHGHCPDLWRPALDAVHVYGRQ